MLLDLRSLEGQSVTAAVAESIPAPSDALARLAAYPRVSFESVATPGDAAARVAAWGRAVAEASPVPGDAVAEVYGQLRALLEALFPSPSDHASRTADQLTPQVEWRFAYSLSQPDRFVWKPPAEQVGVTVQPQSAPQRLVWSATLVDGMAAFQIRQGDTGRPLSVLFKNQDGSDATLPSETSCQFTMVQRQTGHVVTGPASLSGASNNVAVYPFSNPADTAQPGLYDAAWVMTYPSAGTVVAAGSDGVSLPVDTINVLSTVGFPLAGTLTVEGTTGVVSYTGKSGSSFTGCTGGSGTMTLGDGVDATPLKETFPTSSRGTSGYTVEVTPDLGDVGLSG